MSAATSHAPQHLTMVRRVSTPASWPVATATPRSDAHRALPSMMTATCRGRCARSMPSGPIAGSSFHDGADVDAAVDAVSRARLEVCADDPGRRPDAEPRAGVKDPFLPVVDGRSPRLDLATSEDVEASSTDAARGWASARTDRTGTSRGDDPGRKTPDERARGRRAQKPLKAPRLKTRTGNPRDVRREILTWPFV